MELRERGWSIREPGSPTIASAKNQDSTLLGFAEGVLFGGELGVQHLFDPGGDRCL